MGLEGLESFPANQVTNGFEEYVDSVNYLAGFLKDQDFRPLLSDAI